MAQTIKPGAMLALACTMFISSPAGAQEPSHPVREEPAQSFHWPEGKRAAVSLSFDDGRVSQVDTGLALFRRLGIKVTFFLEASTMEKRLAGWKQAVAEGHEIGNHSVTHPCTANYPDFRKNGLEDYTLQMMAAELDGANAQIEQQLGVKPRTFAYPCGLKFVGRGLDVRSYVPLIAERFLVGRGYLDEGPNDPALCDLSQAMGTALDDMDFPHMKRIVDRAAQEGSWVIFAGHEVGQRGFQVTDVAALEALVDYMKDPAQGIWVGTVEEIGRYIRDQRRRSP